MAATALIVMLFLLVRLTIAQSVLDVLSAHPNLNQITSLITRFPRFSERLNVSQDFTFLALSNDAVATWLNSSSPSNDYIQATLEYHLFDRILHTKDITTQPAFFFTALKNTTYTNVTSDSVFGRAGFGQAVEVVDNDGVVFVSGNKSESRIETEDIICSGGIIQIIDRVLSIPTQLFHEAVDANLKGFVNLISSHPFSSAEQYTILPELTVFAPNLTAPPAHASGIYSINTLYDYHMVDGLWYSIDFNGTNLKTKQGTEVLVTLDEKGDIWINQAKITGKDYLTANGVMHVIEDVLLPGNVSRPSFASTGTNVTTSSPASSNPSRLSTGAKFGIAIGVIVAGLLVIVAVVARCFWGAWGRRELVQNEPDKPPKLDGTPQLKQTAELTSEGPVQLDSWQRPAEMGGDQRYELG